MARDRQGPRHRKAMGLDVSTERSQNRGLCSVVVCACSEEGTSRQRARQKKKEHTSNTPQRHRRARSTKRAGSGGTGRSKKCRRGTAGGEKKNHSSAEQYQQRQVTTWGKGKGHGGRGGQEEGPTTGPDGKTLRKQKGAGRGRKVLGSRTGPGKAADLVGPRQRVAGSPKKKKRDAGKRGRDRKGHVTRTTRRPQGTRTAWEAA